MSSACADSEKPAFTLFRSLSHTHTTHFFLWISFQICIHIIHYLVHHTYFYWYTCHTIIALVWLGNGSCWHPTVIIQFQWRLPMERLGLIIWQYIPSKFYSSIYAKAFNHNDISVKEYIISSISLGRIWYSMIGMLPVLFTGHITSPRLSCGGVHAQA